jgi:hypothetical protein
MIDTHKLKRIIHKEQMKEPIPDYGYEKSGVEYKKEWNEFIDKHIPNAKELKHNDWIKYRNIPNTEYKERFVSPPLDLEVLDFTKAQLIRAQRSILMGALYIYVCVMALFGIYIWA